MTAERRVPRRPTAEMVVAGCNVDPPCAAGEFIQRWEAAHDAAIDAALAAGKGED